MQTVTYGKTGPINRARNAELEITQTAETSNGWAHLTEAGTATAWAPATGNSLLVVSYKLTGHASSGSIMIFLEYLWNNKWELLDFITLVGPQYCEAGEALIDQHFVTCQGVRIRVSGTAEGIEACCQVEALEFV